MLFVLLSWFVTRYAKYIRIRPAVGVRLTGGGLFEFLIAMRKSHFQAGGTFKFEIARRYLVPFLIVNTNNVLRLYKDGWLAAEEAG